MNLAERLKNCMACPRKCKVDRTKDLVGRCKATDKVKVALVSTHYYEEPPISGTKGSGTIFFTGCNLGCVYCQNHEITNKMYGKEVDIKRLANIMLEQQEKGVHNINLVTPTIYVYHIIEAIKIARKNGLKIPIVYNTSGYETEETINALNGYIDIYLPDFKYIKSDIAKRYSNAQDYPLVATKALKLMRQQVKDTFDNNGIMQSGMIVRHMILPNNIDNTKAVVKWIKENLGENTLISIMAQYFPTHKANMYEEINRKVTQEELEEIQDYLEEQNMLNGYIQELEEKEECYVPNFNLDGV